MIQNGNNEHFNYLFQEFFNQNLPSLENSNQKFWDELDMIKLDLFQIKNTTEEILNEISDGLKIAGNNSTVIECRKQNKDDQSTGHILQVKIGDQEMNKPVANQSKTPIASKKQGLPKMIIDVDLQLPNARKASGNADKKAANSQSPPKKTSLTIKLEENKTKASTTSSPQVNIDKNRKDSSTKPVAQPQISNINIKPVKIQKLHLNTKAPQDLSKVPVAPSSAKNASTKKMSQPLSNSSTTPTQVTISVAGLAGPTPKKEDPKPIIINLSEDNALTRKFDFQQAGEVIPVKDEKI